MRTVLGDVDPADVGMIAFHEHVLFDIVPPGLRCDLTADITIENRWQIDYRSNESPANAFQTDPDIAATELEYFKQDGGGLIVDQSVAGLARDADGLARASQASSVHVVAAAGCYTDAYAPDHLKALRDEELTELFVAEVKQGADGGTICAGLIGEIGCSWPLEAFEARALTAASRAAIVTGAALSVHPGRSPNACNQILDIIEGEGLDLSRVVLCHMDRTHPNGEGVRELLERGANVEWDFFGIEQSHYWMDDTELPTDRGRLRLIKRFADEGYADQILVSQDICTKTRMRRWGGHGYGHIFRKVVPLMNRMGFDDALIDRLLRKTPLRLLTLQEGKT
ncbi:MAG: aryldialkylphosphatase [Pseudomonadota bacterium]